VDTPPAAILARTGHSNGLFFYYVRKRSFGSLLRIGN
jgi:hypothetical protein